LVVTPYGALYFVLGREREIRLPLGRSKIASEIGVG
jgi:hypothetical protein